MRSFLDGVPAFLTAGLPTPPTPRVPDGRRLVQEVISPKSSVLYYLVDVPPLVKLAEADRTDCSFREAVAWQVERIRARGDRKLKILWNHRERLSSDLDFGVDLVHYKETITFILPFLNNPLHDKKQI
ncbi:unnamed protein product [Dibothriocephalus latus]|uniref:Uncharacterized protein n=1 Tax=Dibothriocephalus latus TaxID=60516 RepID=A0A3P6TRP1_DIBLA|nr:unnamed protein product [Dibothriocephalus latus]